MGTAGGRTLMASVAGAGLSAAGVVFQSLLRNPLAEPYVLGVTAGAGLACCVGDRRRHNGLRGMDRARHGIRRRAGNDSARAGPGVHALQLRGPWRRCCWPESPSAQCSTAC